MFADQTISLDEAVDQSTGAAEAQLAAPFPWFGGKSKVASIVWERLGAVDNYVEPFFGSGAVMLQNPRKPRIETINDKDLMVANFWRATKYAPAEVAQWADWPVSECDLEARHGWLVTHGRQKLTEIMGDPEAFDAKVAGWWLWGICQWIGSGWCSGEGSWIWEGEWRKLPHIGDAGRGINRKLPHIGDAGRGINRKLPHIGDAGRGEAIQSWIGAIAERLRDVRVCCGDWSRVCGPSPTTKLGLTGVFLDPPYSAADRSEVYAQEDYEIALVAREWAISVAHDPLMRIAFCGYAGEFSTPWPAGWSEVVWKSKGGYGSQGNGNGRANSGRERLWFSPNCLNGRQGDLFSAFAAGACE